MKDCKNCQIVKTIDNFREYKNGGIRSVCKSCDNEYDKKRKKDKRASKIKDCDLCDFSGPVCDFSKLKKKYKKIFV